MNQHDPLDERLTRALESVPHIAVPNDFTLRVLAQLPARPAPGAAVPETRPSIGRRVCLAALLVLFIAMLAVGPRSGASHLVEYTCAAEFILLSLWLSLSPQTA